MRRAAIVILCLLLLASMLASAPAPLPRREGKLTGPWPIGRWRLSHGTVEFLPGGEFRCVWNGEAGVGTWTTNPGEFREGMAGAWWVRRHGKNGEDEYARFARFRLSHRDVTYHHESGERLWRE